MLGIEVSAKDKDAAERHQKESKAKSQPDVPPENGQIEHRRKHGGNEEEQSGERADCHFFHHGTILHIRMILGWKTDLPELLPRHNTIAVLEFALNQKNELFRARQLKSFGNRGTPE